MQCVHRDDTILTGGDQGLGVTEGCTGDLSNVEVLEEASRLAGVSGTAMRWDGVAFYLPVVAEEEANAVVCVAPFEEFVIW